MKRTTGAQLRRQRIHLAVSVAAVARSFGCTRQNVQGIERSARVSDERAQRYRDALTGAALFTASPADAGGGDVEAARAVLAALDERLAALAAERESDRP